MTSQSDPFTYLAQNVAYETPWIRVDHYDVLTPTGKPSVYGMVRFKNRAVGVLPIGPDGQVWLVGQYRPPLQRYSWEIPEGGAGMEGDLATAARREMEEEIGLKAGVLVEVLRLALSNSVTDERAWCYLAWDLSDGKIAPDETEVLQIRKIGFMALLEEIFAGQIDDAITVATALRAYHMAMTGQLPAGLAQAMLRPTKEP